MVNTLSSILFFIFIFVVSVVSECKFMYSLGRIDPGWLDSQGRNTYVWRYYMNNSGTEPITSITVGVSDWKNSEVITKWNLEFDESNPLAFTVTNYYQLHPGQIWDGAGFIASGSPYLLPGQGQYSCP